MAKRKSNTPKGERAQQRAAADKEIRKKLAALKKRGLIFQKKSLRDYKPTTYAKRRLKELEGVLTGEKIAIKAPKAVRYKYKGLPNTSHAGGKIIVPNRPGAKAQIRRGMIAFIEPLGKNGHYIEEIVLPVNLRRPDQVKRWIESGEPERLKHPDEYFAFKYFGNASLTALPNAESLLDYLMTYDWFNKESDNELNPSDDEERPAALELFRVYPPDAWDAYVMENKLRREDSPEYKARAHRKAERKKTLRRIRYHAKKRKAKKEAGPTAEERKAQKIRMRQYRATVQADPKRRADRNERNRNKKPRKPK